ncbi:hypothetical protein B0T18DRAFT_430330 [Schizothecium vesticola]|uniref:Uncharacterized protein n=1 Tax=Schizothecium vesticola TaxID=314040 RepID=A0AA40EP61_9PEZI|nr:hypothetical protein B0T18DRAFT_430330 [Schizothecium vesticola]
MTQAPPSSVRLHITPLDPDLLTVVLSSALLPKATNISYHALETFPEKRYGFLNLPPDDAEKLKKKLNGAVVKGQKIRIQTARPESLPTPLGDEMARPKETDTSRDVKKRKRDDVVVLEGAQLEGGRKVKRGWTAAAAADEAQDKDRRARKEKGEKRDKKEKKARRQEKSKFTDHEECLVKTILPANAVPAEDAGAVASKSKKKKNAREVVVHEFEKTTKFPTFLKTTVASTGAKRELEYVEGKGWVDETGTVVEPVKAKPVTRSRAPIFKKRAPVPDSSSSSSSGADESDEEDASDSESTSASPLPKADRKGKVAQMKDSEPSLPQSDSARPKSSGSPKNLSIRIPPATPKDAKVHPLEALYKRPAPADGVTTEPEQTSEKPFSFFDHANDDASDGEAPAATTNEEEGPKTQQALMMTPFTRRDIETRGIRSAAPTPDTAHPSRRFKPWDDDAADGNIAEESEDEDMVGEGSPSGKATRAAGGREEAAATSDFQKWFWENRGDINRSWKKRRKQAGKEKRYRENKARMAKAI